MPQETKSNGRKDPYDRFYTPLTTVDQCLALLDLNKFDCIIEPSAGTGHFSQKLPNCFAFDIVPAAANIQQADWLTMDKAQFKTYSNILVCGNPPFGEQSSLAIAFFNEAAKIAHTIAFILPLSFKKDSIQNKLNLHFVLKNELILQNCDFKLPDNQKITVPCVFQIWEKTSSLRKKRVLATQSEYFSFTTKENADFRVQRVGGNAGKASLDLNRSASSNYFIQNLSNLSNEDFVTLINTLTFPTIAFTVGPKSLSKGELVSVIEQALIKNQ